MKFDKYCTGCEECNRRIPLFDSLTEDELKLLNKDRYSVRFHEGEVILKQGTRVDYQVSVVDGFAKMYIEGYQNRNLILDFLKPMQLISCMDIQLNSKQMFNVVAVRETLVCFIDLNNFRAVLASNSTFSEQFLIHCSMHYQVTLDRMVGISQKQMHGRVADALIYLSKNIYKSSTIGDEITRQDIAEYSSMTKDSAIRVLKEFERDQIISLKGRQIEVLDSNRLDKISDKG